MPITALFRTILIAGMILSVLGVVAATTLSDTLPPILQEYLLQVKNEEMSHSDTIIFIIAVFTLFILLIVTTIGLWKFKHWARVVYISVTIACLPFSPLMDPVMMNPWEAMFDHSARILEGVLIAMMFFTPIDKEFKIKS